MKVFLSILNTFLNVPVGFNDCDQERVIHRRDERFPAGTISSSPWEGWRHHEPIAGAAGGSL